MSFNIDADCDTTLKRHFIGHLMLLCGGVQENNQALCQCQIQGVNVDVSLYLLTSPLIEEVNILSLSDPSACYSVSINRILRFGALLHYHGWGIRINVSLFEQGLINTVVFMLFVQKLDDMRTTLI